MELFTELGYTGLLISSFLAATILPLSSEVVLSALLFSGFNPALLVTIATIGNVLGSFVNYIAGFHGSLFTIKKVLKTSEDAFQNAQKRFNRYGVFCLLFAWVPIIGDPLTVIAGVLRVNLITFFSLVSLGKLTRYLIITYLLLMH